MDVATHYRQMRWNAPLSQAHAERLLDALRLREGVHVADLGCGWGELLLRAAARGATGTGIDHEPAHLQRAESAAAERGLADRVRFVAADASCWRGSADRAMCVGATHAFGGLEPALRALASIVPSTGRVLLGEGYWATEASPAALELFGDAVPGRFDRLRAACTGNGWRIERVSTASPDEWDEFEAASRAGMDARLAETRKAEYERVYRGVLGFAYLLLESPSSSASTAA